MIDERTRTEVQRLCTHVIARERKARTGRIGLAWVGDGIGTDALRLGADGLRRTADGATRAVTTLDDAATFAGVDLALPLDVGHETPSLGDRQAPLAIASAALTELLGFFDRAWRLLGQVVGGTAITLWPEHFDAAFTWRDKANVGASPGDGFSPQPYFYVGPWGTGRPGPPALWNAPFGGSISAGADDGEIAAFLRLRLAALEGTASS
jgi:hypothetical protein